MIRRARCADIIETASKHKSYLNAISWLCSVIDEMCKKNEITEAEAEQTCHHIHESLGVYTFLRTKLTGEGVISPDCKYGSPEYREAATKYWADLVNELRKPL